MMSRFLIAAALAAFSAVATQAMPVSTPCNVENVCYIIDQSGSITSSEYTREQSFVVSISNEVEGLSVTDPFHSAVVFSNNAKIIQNPTQDLNDFQASVNKPRIFNGGTIISSGLRACKDLLTSASGSKVLVLLTDGMTSTFDIPTSKQVAAEAINAGMDIITVGVGNSVSADFLRELASDPSLYIQAGSFGNIDDKISDVVEKICDPVPEPDECEKAFDECEFTFRGQDGLATFDISGEPDMAFTTAVVPKDVTYGLGVLNTNNIVPEFIDDSGASPITNFGSQSFTPTHFKPFWIAQDRGSGVGHQTFQGNQAQVAKDKCVRIYFTSFQEIRENRVINRNNVPRSQNKCVVFRTM